MLDGSALANGRQKNIHSFCLKYVFLNYVCTFQVIRKSNQKLPHLLTVYLRAQC